MKNTKEFGYREVLLEYIEDKDAQFTKSNSVDEKELVEAKILAIGAEVEFFKVGDKVLLHKEIFIKRKHKSFLPNEVMIDNYRQIICRLV